MSALLLQMALVLAAAGTAGMALGWACFRNVAQGQALIVTGTQAEPKVSFDRTMVLPIMHRAELMDVTAKTLTVSCRGANGMLCADHIRADIDVVFFIRVNHTPDDVRKAARMLGTANASDPDVLFSQFAVRFADAIKSVGKRVEFEELHQQRDAFRDDVFAAIGPSLDGFVLDELFIDYLQQTPRDELDPNNLLDAKGILKSTTIAAAQQEETLKLEAQMAAARQQSNEAIRAQAREHGPLIVWWDDAANKLKVEAATQSSFHHAVASQRPSSRPGA